MVLRTASELTLWLAQHPKVERLTLAEYQDARLPAMPQSLVSLSLYNCPFLESLKPEAIERQSFFKRIWRRGDLPRQRAYLLPRLRELWIYNCPLLKESFAFSASMRNIAFLHCASLRLENLAHLHLTWLYLVNCPLVDLHVLPQTEQLVIEGCGFSTMPPLPKCLTLLHWRSTCTWLKRFVSLPPVLEMLDIGEMPSLEALPVPPATLTHFDVSFCDGIKHLPDFSATQLYRFSVWKCAQMKVLPPLPATLAVLYVQECQSMRALKLRRDLKLRIYNVNDCPVRRIDSFPERVSSITLARLPELTSIPEIDCDARYVYIASCPQLQLAQPYILDRQLRTTYGAYAVDAD